VRSITGCHNHASLFGEHSGLPLAHRPDFGNSDLHNLSYNWQVFAVTIANMERI
jgi:hypothetical protein